MTFVELVGRTHRAYFVVLSMTNSSPARVVEGPPFEVTEKDSFTIGNGPFNDCCIESIFLSQAHCRIVHRDGAYLLHDLGSTSGFWVNGDRLGDWHFLLDGDFVKIGHTILKFSRDPPRDTVEARLQRGHFARALEILRQTPLHALDAGGLRLLCNLLVHQQCFDEAEEVFDRLSELAPRSHEQLAEYRSCLRAERLLRARQGHPVPAAERRSLLPPSAVPRGLDYNTVIGTSVDFLRNAPASFEDLRDLDDLAGATVPCFLDGSVFDVPLAHIRSLDLTRGKSKLLSSSNAGLIWEEADEPYANGGDPTPERFAAHNRGWFPVKILWYPAKLVTLDRRAHYVFIPVLSTAHRPGDRLGRMSGGDPMVRYPGERHFRFSYSSGNTHSTPLRWLRRLTVNDHGLAVKLRRLAFELRRLSLKIFRLTFTS